jgi:hypothetical protein
MSGQYSEFLDDQTNRTLTPAELVFGAEDIVSNLGVLGLLLASLGGTRSYVDAAALVAFIESDRVSAHGAVDCESQAMDRVIDQDPISIKFPPAYSALRLLARYHRETIQDAARLSRAVACSRIDRMFIAVGCLGISPERIDDEIRRYAQSCNQSAALSVNAPADLDSEVRHRSTY